MLTNKLLITSSLDRKARVHIDGQLADESLYFFFCCKMILSMNNFWSMLIQFWPQFRNAPSALMGQANILGILCIIIVREALATYFSKHAQQVMLESNRVK